MEGEQVCLKYMQTLCSNSETISIGNYFIAVAQEFFRSLLSAIFLFSSIINTQVGTLMDICYLMLTWWFQANILPVIVTNHTVVIAAELVSLLLSQS
jgi:hypothetical protein